VDPAEVAALAAGAYLAAGEPVVLLGDSGTGKTHLLIGLGLAACEHGRRVRYTTCAQLVNELVEAADERRLSRTFGRHGRIELLCLDELGYVGLDARGAELLFQIITERDERASIATARNLPFSEWGSIIPDPRLVAASSTGSPSTPTSSRPAPSPTGCAPPEPAEAPRSTPDPRNPRTQCRPPCGQLLYGRP
jgi:DNA replication protein DnaC